MQPAAKEIIVRVSTNETLSCRLCDFAPDLYDAGSAGFEEICNHLMREHGLHCLHVGQETAHGPPWHSTVAVLGTEYSAQHGMFADSFLR